jgi:hypothetical protein
MSNPFNAWLKGYDTFTPPEVSTEPYTWISCQNYVMQVTSGEDHHGFDNAYRGILTGIFFLSFSGLCFVVLTIKGDDRLSAHP